MNKKKQILVSMFDNIKSNRSYTVVDIRQWLLSNHLQDVITQIRITQDKDVRRTLNVSCRLLRQVEYFIGVIVTDWLSLHH